MNPTVYEGVYEIFKKKRKALYTKALTPHVLFDETVTNGYREFSPYHSKIAAGIIKRIKELPIKKDSVILYLGASHGYTASFVSDICSEGMIFCIDHAPTVVRNLLTVCKIRNNMIPLLGDATKPETYKQRVVPVDCIIQDVAQKDQVGILIKNLIYLKPKGHIILAVKTRSIDVTKRPDVIIKNVEQELKKHVHILDIKRLDPYEKDHFLIIGKRKT